MNKIVEALSYAVRFVIAVCCELFGRRTYRVAITGAESIGKSTMEASILQTLKPDTTKKKRWSVEIEKADLIVRENAKRIPYGEFPPQTAASTSEGFVARFHGGPRVQFFVVPQEHLDRCVVISRFLKPLHEAIPLFCRNLFADCRKTIIRSLQGATAEYMDQPLNYPLNTGLWAAVNSLYDKKSKQAERQIPAAWQRRAEAKKKLKVIEDLLERHKDVRIELSKDGTSFVYKNGKIVVGTSQADLEGDEADSKVVRDLDTIFKYTADLVEADHGKNEDKLAQGERDLRYPIRVWLRADQARYVRGIASTLGGINVLAGDRPLWTHQTLKIGNLKTALPAYTVAEAESLRLDHFDEAGPDAVVSAVLLVIKQIEADRRVPWATWFHSLWPLMLMALVLWLVPELPRQTPFSWLAWMGLAGTLAAGTLAAEIIRRNWRAVYFGALARLTYPEPSESPHKNSLQSSAPKWACLASGRESHSTEFTAR